MKTVLTIEEAIDCFGRELVAKWITRSMKIEHAMEMRRELDDRIREHLKNKSTVEQIFWHGHWTERREVMRKFTRLDVEVQP